MNSNSRFLYLKKISFKQTLPKNSTDNKFRFCISQKNFISQNTPAQVSTEKKTETYQISNKTPIILTKPVNKKKNKTSW